MRKTKFNKKTKKKGGSKDVKFSMESFVKAAKIKAQLLKLLESKVYGSKELSCNKLYHYLYIIDLICETSDNEVLKQMKVDLEKKINDSKCKVKNSIPKEILPKIRNSELMNMDLNETKANNDDINMEQTGGSTTIDKPPLGATELNEEKNKFWKNATRKGEELMSSLTSRLNNFFNTENIDEAIKEKSEKVGGDNLETNKIDEESFGLVLKGGKCRGRSRHGKVKRKRTHMKRKN